MFSIVSFQVARIYGDPLDIELLRSADDLMVMRQSIWAYIGPMPLAVLMAGPILGVSGSRMMGGGFGGCTINIVPKAILDDFQENMNAAYTKEYGKSPEIYVTQLDEGAGVNKKLNRFVEIVPDGINNQSDRVLHVHLFLYF